MVGFLGFTVTTDNSEAISETLWLIASIPFWRQAGLTGESERSMPTVVTSWRRASSAWQRQSSVVASSSCPG